METFVHPLSKTHFARDFPPKRMLKTCKTKHDPTRHESANYIAATILKLQNSSTSNTCSHIYSAETIQELQNAMEFHQQNVHQKQVKTLVTMEGRFEHDPSMTRDRPETVVP